MKRIMACMMALLLVISVSVVPAFADTGAESGQKLKEHGIVTGGNNGDLMLDKKLTRVEMAVLLARLYSEESQAKAYSEPSGFVDEAKVPRWGKHYVSYAKMRGWLEGNTKTGEFDPNGAITGEQLATILLRILGYKTAKWGQNRTELYNRTGIEILPKGEIKRGEVFDALWEAVSEPVISDGVSTLLDLIQQGNHKPNNSEASKKKAHFVWHKENIVKASFFSEGMQRVEFVENGENKVGYVNEKGELAIKLNLAPHPIEPMMLGNDRFSDGRAMIVTGRGVGFIDTTGKVVIEAIYDDASYFSEGLAWVRSGDEWAYIDRDGKVVFNRVTIPGRLDFTAGGEGVFPIPIKDYDFIDGLAYFSDEKYHGLMNKRGEVVIPPSDKYHRLNRFRDGLALVIDETVGNLKFGYIDEKGKIAIPLQFADAYDFHEGLAAVNVGSVDIPKWGFIDKTGRLVIEAQFEEVSNFSEGLAAVSVWDGKDGQKWGYIDKKGKFVFAPMYQFAGKFSEGYAVVELYGRCGIIDKKGDMVVANKYEYIHNVRDGLAIANLDGKSGVIDTKGNEVVEIKYSWIAAPLEGEKCYQVEDGKRLGFFYFED